jgi:hypothetical protein
MVGEEGIPQEYEDENLSPDEEAELLDYLGAGGSSPKLQEQNSVVGFFNKIFKSKDTSKAGNLNEQELLAIRTLQNTADYANEMGLKEVSKFILLFAERTLSTSLSRDAALINAIITSKKQLSTESKVGEAAKGRKSKWLKKD